MKKLTVSMLAIILAVSTIFSFAGCTASPEERLKSFVESDEVQEQISSITESLESTLDIDVRVEGTQLIFDFTYKEQIPEGAIDLVVPQFETAFDSMSSVYDNMINEIETEINVDNVSILIILNNADGTKLYDYEYLGD